MGVYEVHTEWCSDSGLFRVSVVKPDRSGDPIEGWSSVVGWDTLEEATEQGLWLASVLEDAEQGEAEDATDTEPVTS